MAVDLMAVAEVMKTALLRDLGDEIDLIFLYGSHLSGAAHKYSDLDISYVPVHESTWHSITVLVDDILFDLYPIHWSRLESMAECEDVSGLVLLNNRIVYRRSEEAEARLQGLAARFRALQQPGARAEMLRKAQAIFQATAYEAYLLRQQAAAGHLPSCLVHAQHILKAVLHCLAVCNQRCVDTRKLAQVLALPKLPAAFAETIDRITLAHDPDELLAGCEALLAATRELLLAEQRLVHRSERAFPKVFHAAYPELKGNLRHLLLACERKDMFAVNDQLAILYHEMAVHLTWAATGVEYSSFNSLAEYEQDFAALGFPDLLSYAARQDFAALHRQTLAFDQRLREFLTENGAELNAFASAEELAQHLGA